MATALRRVFRPTLETLEGRLAPAVHTWTGAASALWSDDANWQGGSPAGDPEADLMFPQAAANFSNRNDLDGVLVRSMAFRSVGAPTYIISGNPLTLTGGAIEVAPVVGPHSIRCDLVLAADLTLAMETTPFTTGRLSIEGRISGDYGLIMVRGYLLLSGANTYSGGTLLQGGRVGVSGNGPFGTGMLTFDGGGLEPRGAGIDNPFRVAPSRRGSINGEGSLRLSGPGLLSAGSELAFIVGASTILAGDLSGEGALSWTSIGSQFLTLAGSNTYTGSTSIGSGTLRLASDTALSATTTLGMGGRLDVNGFHATVGSLAGGGSVVLGSGSLTVGSNNTSTSYAGVISGEGTVTKVGAGAWTLSGASTFSGGLTLVGGTARLTGNRAAGAGSVAVADGVLEVAANVDVPGTVSNTGVVVVAPGRTLRVGRYEQSSGYTFLAGGTLAATDYVYLGDGGYFGGFGRLEGFVVNAGFLDVGTTGYAGTIVIAGDYAQTASGLLRVELGDLGSGDYDRLDITGTAYLDGVLDVGLLDSFVAAEGDAYAVLTFGAAEGAFWFYNLPELGDGFYLAPIPDANALYLYVGRR